VDAVAFEGVSKYPARVMCALLGWMAMKSAVAEAGWRGDTTSDTNDSDTANLTGEQG
jgi:nitrogen fixation protein NifU and related proteins